jgi:hypothetical protein
MNHAEMKARSLTAFLFVSSFLWEGVCQSASIITRPYQGITHIARSEVMPRNVNMNIVLVDLRARGIRFKLTPPGGTLDTVRETTLEFLNREQAQVAINCHFMLPYPSTNTNANVVGLAASKGNVYSPFEPQPLGFEYVDQSYAILPYAPALNISRVNRARIVHHNPLRPDNKRVVERVRLWNAVSGSAQIVSDGAKTIPTYSGPPDGLNPLNGYWDLYSWYALARARTVIGLTADNRTLVLFTVDEVGGSIGLSVGEVADILMNDYQVYNALNLDGGGSTTLAMQDPATRTGRIVNVSSDNPLGRSVGSNLGIFARPVRRTNVGGRE